ncbi:hypothetical protein niasHT_016458 [Heterodera trifolii]|uniref:Uncharacterized protein n=1 Tax=Heterodera trifolii TaxID=157864 RepID=A0ABD2KXF6_9BILA
MPPQCQWTPHPPARPHNGNDENQPPEIGPAPPFGPVHQNALGLEFGPLPQHAFGPMNQHGLGPPPQLFGPAAHFRLPQQVHGVWQTLWTITSTAIVHATTCATNCVPTSTAGPCGLRISGFLVF